MFNRIVAMGGSSVSKALTGVVKKFTINEGHILTKIQWLLFSHLLPVIRVRGELSMFTESGISSIVDQLYYCL